MLFNQRYSDLPVLHDYIIVTGLDVTLPVGIHERKVAHRVYLESEGLRLAGLNEPFLEMFQFLHRTGDDGIRVGNIPLDGFLAVHLSGIGDSDGSRDGVIDSETVSRNSQSPVIVCGIAESVAALPAAISPEPRPQQAKYGSDRGSGRSRATQPPVSRPFSLP